ncbi:VanZ family protein [Candidatus Halobonum tyrrellensis]|uniref:VanZ like family protein n=1 Tax=Candidatus Halobonum tyrrellensis G22 TaxID=1324957 RepID=V4GUE9_9EURY|nr:VanZ family protein [Candidatus Halobonum tyrrellensis]ESP88766.1 VanZ like family protein [Candidatus Halobonum tyrrellensis G22]
MSEPTPRGRWLAVVVVAGVVVVASLVPRPAGGVAVTVGPVGADKLLHAAGYATVAFLLARAFRVRERRPVRVPFALGVAAAAAVALGGGVELLQSAVPGRTASVADAGANLVGAVGGAAAWRAWRRSVSAGDGGHATRSNDRQ